MAPKDQILISNGGSEILALGRYSCIGRSGNR